MAPSQRKKVLSSRKKNSGKTKKPSKKSSKKTSKKGALEFVPIKKMSTMRIVILVGIIIAISLGGGALFGWLFGKEGLATLGSGGSSGNLPNTALYAPKEYDIQARNRCHGTGCGRYEVDVWGAVDPVQKDEPTDNLIIDEQNASHFRRLQVPLVVSNDPAGGTLPYIGRDPVDTAKGEISFGLGGQMEANAKDELVTAKSKFGNTVGGDAAGTGYRIDTLFGMESEERAADGAQRADYRSMPRTKHKDRLGSKNDFITMIKNGMF